MILTLDFKDLNIFSIECSHCGTKVTLDFSKTAMKVPAECPSCREKFDAASVQSPLVKYKQIFNLLTANRAPNHGTDPGRNVDFPARAWQYTDAH
jgi:uncharacterized protein (UPF0212 family)